MYKGLKLSQEKQIEIVNYVAQCSTEWEDMLKDYHNRMQDVRGAIGTFKEKESRKGTTQFKINEAFKAVNKTLPKLMSKGPSFIVTPARDAFDEQADGENPIDGKTPIDWDTYEEIAKAVQDYLKTTFAEQNLEKTMRLRAKGMLTYGMSFAKACYRYQIARGLEYKEETEYNQDGEEIKRSVAQTTEKVAGEMPTIEVKKRNEMLFDPRYTMLEDMPGIIDITKKVRLSYFTKRRKEYMNMDKLVDIVTLPEKQNNKEDVIYSIVGIRPTSTSELKPNTLTIKTFQGYYDVSDEKDMSNEKLYEFITVSDTILLSAKEITQYSYEAVHCFEDTDTFFGTGMVEPIIGLQDNLNFQKNAANAYINQALYRPRIRSPNSGINPKSLANMGPGEIIPTRNEGAVALANIPEIPFQQLPPAYFQNQSDMDRQIQTMTFSIDTTQAAGNQALTNTATGMKINFYESNGVVEEIRRHLEESMVRLAYKFLQLVWETADDNIQIKKLGDEGFWQINREAFKNAILRYEIRIESGSSSFDSVEQRRNDAIAILNIGKEAKNGGSNIDFDGLVKNALNTFEGVNADDFIKPQMPQMPQQQMSGGPLNMTAQPNRLPTEPPQVPFNL